MTHEAPACEGCGWRDGVHRSDCPFVPDFMKHAVRMALETDLDARDTHRVGVAHALVIAVRHARAEGVPVGSSPLVLGVLGELEALWPLEEEFPAVLERDLEGKSR